MLATNIAVENMSHLASSFPVRTEGEGEESIHPSQAMKKRIKLQLLFIIPPEDGSENDYPRLASIRVPKGVPVAKLRTFIRHIETQLQDIYGHSKRANFVMQSEEFADNWTFEFDLPNFGVVYV